MQVIWQSRQGIEIVLRRLAEPCRGTESELSMGALLSPAPGYDVRDTLQR